jgi:hypothetical protein
MRYACKILVRKSKGRPKRNCKDNIKMNPKEMRCECMDWIHLAQERTHWWNNVIINFRIPSKRLNFLIS